MSAWIDFVAASADVSARAHAFQQAAMPAPEWTEAAAESLAAYEARAGHSPSVALISPAAERHMREYARDSTTLLGIPTRVADIDGIDWA